MKTNNKIYNILLCVCTIGVLGYSSCKKYANPPAVYEDLKPLNAGQRKILVISIDGLTGTELQAVAPTNIATLQKNSKYTYNTLKTGSDAAGWVSMLTGTSSVKHQISNDNFERTAGSGVDEHAPIVSYRNVFDYITQYKSVKTAFVTPWLNLRNYMKNADFLPVVSTDLAVKDSTVSILNSQTALGTMVVNFRDVEAAGDNGGYLATNANYKNAIVKSDEYVGNILTALKARKNYANEDWLVIVTSNHGGSSANPTNGFTLVYNPVFKPFELKKSGFNPVLFNNNSGRATLSNDNNLYDAGETKSFTVQMDVKFNSVPTGYASFFSKSTNLSSQVITGWQWALYPGGKWVITVGGSLNGGKGKTETASADAPGTDWHKLTMTVEYVNSTTRNLNMYIDGKRQTTAATNISANKSLSTTEAFRVGHRTGDNDTPTSFYGANLSYFNTALSEAVINSNLSLKDITKHSNYANLIGYWPMDEGTEATFFNKLPVGYNMSLSGVYSWANLGSAYPPGTTPEPITSTLSIPSTVSDVSALALYWMNINILADFGFDGKPYLKNFELEFLK
ncbi:alkaline phosphatase family protein [Pedobacter miscanthi]|uniref:alkaline phosphatase family protein n=1 Tax=Pedobacter miscanthi TaxID=2259170 RepID=UPI0029313DFD|nr:alkaline phosphatase family protein [Pedobacter miscanthi]